jgi:hypothetical protein
MSYCYVYKWVHIPSLMWYVGSRTSKKSRRGDSYICSSPQVKALIQSDPDNWQRTIVAEGSADEMLLLEQTILTLFDAASDNRSYNKYNSDMKFNRTGSSWNGKRSGINNPNYGKSPSAETRNKIALTKIGKSINVGRQHLPETKEKIRIANIGRTMSLESRKKISIAHQGVKRKPHSPETIEKMRLARQRYWDNKNNDK